MDNELKENLNSILVEKQQKILPQNIKKDIEIYGVTGTLETLNTSDANATAGDISVNKTAYVNGQKITGTLPLFPNSRTFVATGDVALDAGNSKVKLSTTNGTKQIIDSNVLIEISADYSAIATAIGLTADKIKSGETILGITGTYTGETPAEPTTEQGE